jgi:hypothetical protein
MGGQSEKWVWVKGLSSVLYYAGVCGQSFARNLANNNSRRICDIDMLVPIGIVILLPFS